MIHAFLNVRIGPLVFLSLVTKTDAVVRNRKIVPICCVPCGRQRGRLFYQKRLVEWTHGHLEGIEEQKIFGELNKERVQNDSQHQQAYRDTNDHLEFV